MPGKSGNIGVALNGEGKWTVKLNAYLKVYAILPKGLYGMQDSKNFTGRMSSINESGSSVRQPEKTASSGKGI